jgi:hypothetical protein
VVERRLQLRLSGRENAQVGLEHHQGLSRLRLPGALEVTLDVEATKFVQQ